MTEHQRHKHLRLGCNLANPRVDRVVCKPNKSSEPKADGQRDSTSSNIRVAASEHQNRRSSHGQQRCDARYRRQEPNALAQLGENYQPSYRHRL